MEGVVNGNGEKRRRWVRRVKEGNPGTGDTDSSSLKDKAKRVWMRRFRKTGRLLM